MTNFLTDPNLPDFRYPRAFMGRGGRKMSNSAPEIQCSLKPWMLDISYVYHVENFARSHRTLTLYERYLTLFLLQNTDPKEIVQNHLDYIRDVLDTTAYFIDERRRRREFVWMMRSMYFSRMHGKRK